MRTDRDLVTVYVPSTAEVGAHMRGETLADSPDEYTIPPRPVLPPPVQDPNPWIVNACEFD